MKRVISCVLLMLVLTSNAFALEVPTGTVVQNLNGSQQAIKTFTVSPEQDPAALIEEPFELEGYERKRYGCSEASLLVSKCASR